MCTTIYLGGPNCHPCIFVKCCVQFKKLFFEGGRGASARRWAKQPLLAGSDGGIQCLVLKKEGSIHRPGKLCTWGSAPEHLCRPPHCERVPKHPSGACHWTPACWRDGEGVPLSWAASFPHKPPPPSEQSVFFTRLLHPATGTCVLGLS